jgi:hypothetical protein
MEKTSIASCGWYMERLKRFSAHSLRPMSGRSASLACARIAPAPGSHVCVAYERCAPHVSDSRHSGHALARGAARQGYAAGNAAIRERWPGAKRRTTHKGQSGFLGDVWLSRRYGVTRVSGALVAGRLARKEKGRVLGRGGRATGGSPGEVAVPARESRLSRCESLAGI